MDAEVVELTLPDGISLLARATRIADSGHQGPSDVGLRGPADAGLRELFSFTSVTRTVRVLAAELHKALAAASPDRVTVELGFDLAVKGSHVLALVADGGMRGSIAVRLEWGGDPARKAGDEPDAELPGADDAEIS